MDAEYCGGFNQRTCCISKAERETELGMRTGSLYYLHAEPESPVLNGDTLDITSLGLATNLSPLATLETWHQRLGYRTLDMRSVKYIASKITDMGVSNESIPSTNICAVCAQGC